MGIFTQVSDLRNYPLKPHLQAAIMRSQQQHLFALLVAGAAAVPLEERDLAECGDVAMELLPALTNLPTPDLSLASFIVEQTQLASATDPCEIPAVTGEATSDYSSYMSELSSWQIAHTDDLNSLIDACSDVPEIASSLEMLPGGFTICTEVTWASPTGGSDNDDNDDSSEDNNEDSSNDDSSNDNDNGDNSSDDNNDDSSNDDADSENSNDEGGNGGNAATRDTGSVAVLAAVAMAGLFAAI